MAKSKVSVTVEVVYAQRHEQMLLALRVEPGTTVREAIEQCGITRRFPHMDPARSKVGIFGRLVTPDTVLREGDRVEIYRPLIADPKDSRRQRARMTR